jgi:hypothetical protein
VNQGQCGNYFHGLLYRKVVTNWLRLAPPRRSRRFVAAFILSELLVSSVRAQRSVPRRIDSNSNRDADDY